MTPGRMTSRLADDPPFSALVVCGGDEREPTPRGVDRRNIGIIGAPDSGKSMLVERAEHDARLTTPNDPHNAAEGHTA